MKIRLSQKLCLLTILLVAILVGGWFVNKSLNTWLFLAISSLLLSGMLAYKMIKVNRLLQENTLGRERFEASLAYASNVLFDNVLEADITTDTLIGENALKLTKLLKLPPTTSYSRTIEAVAKQLVHKDYTQQYQETLSVENIKKTLDSGYNTLEFECIERSDGHNYTWIRVNYCIYLSKETGNIRIISYVKNIENEKNAYNRMMENVRKDPMTGLLNKVATKDIVSTMLKDKENEPPIILMIDIDNFKNINDTYGHLTGDEVLISVSEIIKNSFRDTDIIGRMGGDEFLVCLRMNGSIESLEDKISRLIRNVQEARVQLSQLILEGISISVGVVHAFGNDNFDQLYHYADVAMYKAKGKGKNQYFIYNYSE